MPWRTAEVEEIIKGRRLEQDHALQAAEAAVKNAEPMDQNEYKIPLFRGLIEQQLMAIAYPESLFTRGKTSRRKKQEL